MIKRTLILLTCIALFRSVSFLMAAQPQPAAAVVGGLETGIDGIDEGEVLLGELNCVACHAADSRVKARLRPKQAPLLGEAARRIKPDYLRSYIANPLVEKPGTTMPALLLGVSDVEKRDAAADLAQYLGSLSAPAAPSPPSATNRLLIQQGRVLFHQVGCVACHPPEEPASDLFPNSPNIGTLDADASRALLAQLQGTSVPLGDLPRKYAPAPLTEFLADPLRARPSGRMPSLNLTPSEASAITAYLLRHTPGAAKLGEHDDDVLAPDRMSAARGKKRFASLGCAACHRLSARGPGPTSTLRVASMSAIDSERPGGCLSVQPGPGVPRYQLDDAQRAAIKRTLAARQQLMRPLAPCEAVIKAMVSLNCIACHLRGSVGGPGPSRMDYFTVVGETDLGDEGRVPPHLSDTGNKLRPDWLREVLTNKGAVRPYMAVRMPQYGAANVQDLLTAFQQADALQDAALLTPQPTGSVNTGRELVGTGGCSCIACHNFGSRKAVSLGVMDMTKMARRLQSGWFRRYLLDPASLRPGTRMPAFWPEGKAVITNLLNGDTERQIAAIWAFLSQGAKAEPPRGLTP